MTQLWHLLTTILFSFQILLTLVTVVVTQGHYLDPYGINFDLRHYNKPKQDDENRYTSTSVSDFPNSGAYSYKYEKMHDHFFHDGNGFTNVFDPYFGYPDLLKRPNFDNMPLPFGLPNTQNKYAGKFSTSNKVGDDKASVEKFDNNHTPSTESSDMKKNSDKAVDSINDSVETQSYVDTQKSAEPKDKSKEFDERPPKINLLKDDNSTTGTVKKNVTLTANKDYLLVDNNGNNAYILHENILNNVLPNNNQLNLNNGIYVPVTSSKNVVQPPNNQYYQYPNGQLVNNQPNGNNIMYVPLVSNTNNPQQPSSQVYQVLNGQLTNTNPNGYNNVLTNTQQNNLIPNNYNPSYIYIYANGQLTQIPGFVISPQQNLPLQNGYNGVFTSSVPNYGVSKGINPISIQLPTSNGQVSVNQQSGIGLQNLQPNNNLGLYNAQNGYSQSTLFPNYNSAGAINNPGVQLNTAYPTHSDGNNNQQLSPSPQKEANVAGSVPAQYDSPKTSQVTPNTPTETKTYNGVQPALMFTDFKEKENDKDDSKEIDEKKPEA